MVSIILEISKFSSAFSKPLGTINSAPTTIDITLTHKFHSFFSPLERSKYFLFLILFCFFRL